MVIAFFKKEFILTERKGNRHRKLLQSIGRTFMCVLDMFTISINYLLHHPAYVDYIACNLPAVAGFEVSSSYWQLGEDPPSHTHLINYFS